MNSVINHQNYIEYYIEYKIRIDNWFFINP